MSAPDPARPAFLPSARAREPRRDTLTRDRLRQRAAPAYRARAVPEAQSENREPRASTLRDVAARGARIRFVESGEGPPLILVHDYLASHVAWDDVLPRLA